jgi:hypothetical protein
VPAAAKQAFVSARVAQLLPDIPQVGLGLGWLGYPHLTLTIPQQPPPGDRGHLVSSQ